MDADQIFKLSELKVPKEIQGWVVNLRLEDIKATGKFLHTVSPYTDRFLYLFERYKSFFLSALKVYTPVHLILLLLRMRSKKESPSSLMKRFAKGLIQSSAFVACFASSTTSTRVFPLLSSIFSPTFGSWSGFIISFLFSNAILLESPSRWADISLYVLGQWIQGFSYSLVKRKVVAPIPSVERYLLGVSMGLMIYLRYGGMQPDDGSEGQVSDNRQTNKIARMIDLIVGDQNYMMDTLEEKPSQDLSAKQQ